MKRCFALFLFSTILLTSHLAFAQSSRVTLGSYTFPTTGSLDPDSWAGRGDGEIFWGVEINEPGSGYAVNDTGIILGGGTNPNFGYLLYWVTAVDEFGGVLNLSAGPGAGYTASTGLATVNGLQEDSSCPGFQDQPGTGSGLTVNIPSWSLWSRHAVESMAVSAANNVTTVWEPGASPGAYWVAGPPPSDQWIQMTYKGSSGPGGGFVLLLRAVAENAGLGVWLNVDGTGVGIGGWNQCNSVAENLEDISPLSIGDTVRAEVEGDQLRLYVNSTLVGQVTDPLFSEVAVPDGPYGGTMAFLPWPAVDGTITVGDVQVGTFQPWAPGRWKTNANGECYFDPFDAGSNQCTPPVGHWLQISDSSCRWQSGVSGSDDCSGSPECTMNASTTSIQIPAAGQNGTFQLTGDSGCAWSVAPTSSWLTISPASGVGPTTIAYTVGSSVASRVVVASMAGVAVTFTQFGSDTTLDTVFAQDVAVPRIRLDCGTTDCDGDGIPDDVEDDLANKFFPTMHFHIPECGLEIDFSLGLEGLRQSVLYRLRYLSSGGVIDTSHIAINYVVLYRRDCGSPGGVGWPLTAHDGDNEPFAVFLYKDGAGVWQLDYITSIAHQGTIYEIQGFTSALNDNGKPDLWVGYQKHGNFVRLSDCDGGAINQCTNPGQGLAWHLYNVGERLAQFIDDLSVVSSQWSGQRVWGCNTFLHAGVIRDDLYLKNYLWKGLWDDGDIVPGTSSVILNQGSCN